MKGMPKTERERLQSGPIPGENFLSDTKNQPWHRPPKFKDIDMALDHVIENIFEKKRAQTLMTVFELGIPVSTVVSMYLQAGIGQGKWTPDFALLMAGPVAHIFRIMADGYEIDYNMGIDDNKKIPTKTFFEESINLKNKKFEVRPDVEEEAKQMVAEMSGGLAAPEQGQQPEPPTMAGGFMADIRGV